MGWLSDEAISGPDSARTASSTRVGNVWWISSRGMPLCKDMRQAFITVALRPQPVEQHRFNTAA